MRFCTALANRQVNLIEKSILKIQYAFFMEEPNGLNTERNKAGLHFSSSLRSTHFIQQAIFFFYWYPNFIISVLSPLRSATL